MMKIIPLLKQYPLNDLSAKTGISYQQLWNYRHGSRSPNPKTARKIAHAVKLELVYADDGQPDFVKGKKK